MKIEVWREYEGNRAPKKIKEGVYNDDDPRIFGLAKYLIDNGNARLYIEPEKPKRTTRTRKAKK